jgi:Restriction endonuclease
VSSQATVRRVARSVAESLPRGRLVSVKKALETGFREDGASRFVAEELAERWADRCDVMLEEELAIAFDDLGVPRPIVESGRAGIYLTFLHPSYREFSAMWLEEGFAESLDRVTTCTEKELLAIVASVLVARGCDPVLITDGANDGGVDVAGRLSGRPGHGLNVFVQAKALVGPMGGRAIEEEYGVFRAALDNGDHAYLTGVLAGRESRVGSPHTYLLCSRRGFSHAAERAANALRVGLCHPIQVAYWIERAYGPGKIDRLVDACQPIARNFDRNMTAVLREYIR